MHDDGCDMAIQKESQMTFGDFFLAPLFMPSFRAFKHFLPSPSPFFLLSLSHSHLSLSLLPSSCAFKQNKVRRCQEREGEMRGGLREKEGNAGRNREKMIKIQAQCRVCVCLCRCREFACEKRAKARSTCACLCDSMPD